jgi:hypothetical protein
MTSLDIGETLDLAPIAIVEELVEVPAIRVNCVR